MARRMERYSSTGRGSKHTRSSKNKKLYNSFDNEPMYTTITDVRNANAYQLSPEDENYKTRESYQKLKDFKEIMPTPKVKKELEDFNYLYKDKEKKIYDINSVIEEAKKNREDSDVKTEKKEIDKNLIITLEDIEEYRKMKAKKKKLDDDDMKDLLNTITSKTLRGEIDQATSVNLLSDLMATSKMDRIEDSKDVLNEEDLKQVKEKMESEDKEDTNIENSFFTKSVDLSEKDFFLGEYEDDEDEDGGVPIILKIFLAILLTALLAILVYFVFKGF